MRLGLLLVLMVVALLVAHFYPVDAEEAWPHPLRFEPDDAECRAERETRQWTRYRLPEEADWATVEEVARKLSVDESWVCRANGWEAGCGREPVEAGDSLILPLHGAAVESALLADPGTPGAPEP